MSKQPNIKSSNPSLVGILAILWVFFYTTIGLAEQTILSVGQQGNHSISTPKTGQDSETVLSLFGEPNQKTQPVGEPPISKWIYHDFTVYFENDLVIHSVIHNQSNN